jgi:hypothetical protein
MNTTIQDEIIEHYSKAKEHMIEASKLSRTFLNEKNEKQPIVPIIAMASKYQYKSISLLETTLKIFTAYKNIISSDPYLIQNYDKMSAKEVSTYCGCKMMSAGSEKNT